MANNTKRFINIPQSVSQWVRIGTAYLQESPVYDPCGESVALQATFARLETELLLCHVLGVSRLDLYCRPNRVLSEEETKCFEGAIRRRALFEPLQYITGGVKFYGLDFEVGPGVFIPRPETEWIVEVAREITPPPRKILDICTGSGVLAITLSHYFPDAQVTAIDCSSVALAIAARNAARHQCLSRIRFLQGDLFDPIPREVFDWVVCNPPYIPEADRGILPPDVRDYEPPEALFSGEDGVAHHLRIFSGLPDVLHPNGIALIEIGKGQAERLGHVLKRESGFSFRFFPDDAGIDRILFLQRK